MRTEKESFVFRGSICYSRDKDRLQTFDDAYLVCVGGRSKGVFDVLPERYGSLPRRETGHKLIIPGLVDLHIHAPQYQFRGTGMDMELLEWLETYAFPEEAKYEDLSYAKKAYGLFVKEMKKGATTRASIFATSHRQATVLLMKMLEETGLVTCVGKVNMDRNVPSYYVESTEQSLAETKQWIEDVEESGFRNTRAILTPRFVPSCTGELMKGLAELAQTYDLPSQSHLSENLSEIEYVRQLEPDTSCYAQSYVKAGLMGQGKGCIMAHCVWSGEEEQEILRENGVFIAHSPDSNTNLFSGAAPVKTYLQKGLHVGLATDVAGGATTSMIQTVRTAIQVSKLRNRLYDRDTGALTFPEAFYLATKGGGAFFDNAGSFDAGCPFDALVLDDGAIPTTKEDMSVEERAERFFYLGDDRHILEKYVNGVRIL